MQTIAIIGATGAVGREILKILEERNFPLRYVRCFASPRSQGKTIPFRGEQIPLEILSDFHGIEMAFFCAGSPISKEWIPKTDALIIDSSSAFRMEFPLVIPEINAHAMKGRVITSPNCAATMLLMPLFALHRRYRVKRIVASTYQAASGGGEKLLQRLLDETKAHLENRPLPALPYAFNLYPHDSRLDSSGYVEEELKMAAETRKILEDDSIQVTATCIRVPVLRAHSVAANVEFHTPPDLSEIPTLLKEVRGLRLFEDRSHNRFPTPFDATGQDDVFCGRFRLDRTQPNTLEFWSVGDQLRKGAALNAVQIAEALLNRN